jgi:hypothetical protein
LFRGPARLFRALQCASSLQGAVEAMSLPLTSSSPWQLIILVILLTACISKEPDRDVKEAEEVDSH